MALADLIARRRLEGELDRWRRLDRRPTLWWRDDDAKEPTIALDRLLGLAKGRPITLAIVPLGPLAALADRVRGAPGLTVAQHGTDHINRRSAGQPPNEYPPEAKATDVALAIAAARRRMAAAGLEPLLYVPPWNQVDQTLLDALRQVGYSAYSAASDHQAANGLVQIGAQLDILRWGRASPCFRGETRIWDGLRRRLRAARRAGQFHHPIGLLTHHLAHDEDAWRFLERFLIFADDAFQWSPFETVVGYIDRGVG